MDAYLDLKLCHHLLCWKNNAIHELIFVGQETTYQQLVKGKCGYVGLINPHPFENILSIRDFQDVMCTCVTFL
jgi:hypothetical protein